MDNNSKFTGVPFSPSIQRDGKSQIYNRYLLAHIPTAHSGKIMQSDGVNLETFTIGEIPYIVYQLSKITTVGVIPEEVANNIVKFFLNELSTIQISNENDNYDNYMTLCKNLNVYCEEQIRKISMPDISKDVKFEMDELENNIKNVNETIDDIEYNYDYFETLIKGINETLKARMSFANNHRNFGELKLYMPGDTKYNNMFIPDNSHRDGSSDAMGNIVTNINWYNPLFFMGKMPTAYQITETSATIANNIESGADNTTKFQYGDSLIPFINAIDLGYTRYTGRNTRSGLHQTGYKESELYELLSTQQKTMIFTINLGCQVLLKINAAGVFESEYINQQVVTRINRRLKRNNNNKHKYDDVVERLERIENLSKSEMYTETGSVIPLEMGLDRVLRSYENINAINETEKKYITQDFLHFKKLIRFLIREEPTFSELKNLVGISGGSKPKSTKSTKSKKFQRRSKRRNNRRTYKKKARKTKRRRRY
jgi:hypothetical protein